MNVKLMQHKSPLSSTVLLSRGNIKRDESHYSFVLAQLGVNKMCGFMSGSESTLNGKQTCSSASQFFTGTTEGSFIGATGRAV